MSSTPPTVNLNQEASTALRVIIPVIYILFAILGIVGNLIVLQIICANRFRHKSIHLLVCSLAFADSFFIIIFTIVRAVSYAYLTTSWFINPNEWCKAEMYLLRLFDFVLAYTVVFMCFDRAVRAGSCWFGVRKFRAGISILVSIWLASAYVLIPILLFKQTVFSQSYGGYLCYSTDESVPLFWLGNFPRRILDFIDIVFRTLFPVFLMIILLFIGSFNLCAPGEEKQITKSNASFLNSTQTYPNFDQYASSTTLATNSRILPRTEVEPKADPITSARIYNNRLYSMVLGYSLLFVICQLPYEIYRCVLLWNQNIETSLWSQNLDFAIEIPLLLLKLINRCVNPFLFICLGDFYSFRNKCCRLWCCPCIPGCIGCNQCWFFDCWRSICFEFDYCLGRKSKYEEEYVPTGLQTISTYQYRDGNRLVTKQKIIEEYETGVEPYYKNPKLRDRQEECGAFVNENFENDDQYNISTARLNPTQTENLRVKL